MKAARIDQYGTADVIKIVDIEKPTPARGQVLVEVYASSINPFDSKVREGARGDKLSFPFTLGVDIAGIVEEIGEGVENFSVGDRVYGRAGVVDGGSGAFAEYAATPVGIIAIMPRNLNFLEAGVIPLTGVSAVQVIVDHIKLRKGQKILIHGGAGGIGSAAIQLSKLTGAKVTSTGTGGELDFIKQLGAEPFDYQKQKFEDVLSGFDAVLDTVGGEIYARSFKVLKRGGIIVSMTTKPNNELMEKYGVTAIHQATRETTESLSQLREYIEQGAIKAHVDKVYPLEKIKDAFIAKETGEVHGKIGIEIKKV